MVVKMTAIAEKDNTTCDFVLRLESANLLVNLNIGILLSRHDRQSI